MPPIVAASRSSNADRPSVCVGGRSLAAVLTLGLVCPLFLGAIASAQTATISGASSRVDALLAEAWQDDGITPAPIAGDAEFHRRAWLDLAGVAPTVWRTRQFLNDTDPQKRGRLVERLLQSPQRANHMASVWNDVLLPADAQTDFASAANVAALHQWLRNQFYNNTPYDYLVAEFLTAGGAGNSGPAIFYTSHSLEPEKLAAATSRIFMGIQIQCAQCHDHPFDRWTQKDFWQYAAFFSQLESSDSMGGGSPILEDRVGGEVTMPDTDQTVAPRYPGAERPPESDPTGNRRRQLTIWMASRDNPYLARSAVNRVWYHLFGRGLVNPVDAMDADNHPSHPEVLDFLADYFTENRFDLRLLYQVIAGTDAYGRTSEVPTGDRPPADAFAVMNVKTLSAHQFVDSLQQNVLHQNNASPAYPGFSAAMVPGSLFSRLRSPGASSTEYPHGVVQTLALINGPEIALATDANRGGLLGSLEAPFIDDAEKIRTLFLATLSRLPTDDEAARFADHLSDAPSDSEQAQRIGDLLWVLVNTAEFAVCP